MILIGIKVYCVMCGREKAPHRRRIPEVYQERYCRDGVCIGYDADPLPGCLWCGEQSDEYAAMCCTNATKSAE